MFGIKRGINKITNPLSKNGRRFPNKPASSLKLKSALLWLTGRLQSQQKHLGLSNLNPRVDRRQIEIWQSLLPFNPNNLGNWSIEGLPPAHETAAFEAEIVAQMADLYKARKEKLEGYITTGATEANIFCSWLGSKYLQKAGVKKEKMCLLKTSLTHYSLTKAADLIGVSSYVLPVNAGTWGMDIDTLPSKIEELVKKGYRGFLMPLTLGYTLTGTVDPYEEICRVARKMKKNLKVEFFVWIDAAFNGLIEPFLNEKFSPFSTWEIQAVAVDFHKFGVVPIPSGLILYRGKLRGLIEKHIDYLQQKDSTLLGSRSGIVGVGCWTMIHGLGRKGFRKIISERQAEMRKFIGENKKRSDIQFIISKRSLNCGIMVKRRSSGISEFSKKYGLDFRKSKIEFVDGKKTLTISKSFFV